MSMAAFHVQMPVALAALLRCALHHDTCAASCSAALYGYALCCAMICCAVLCYAMLCYAMLCCAEGHPGGLHDRGTRRRGLGWQ